MRRLQECVFAICLAAAVGLSAHAAEGPGNVDVFIAIADPETGRALVPEGTVIPAGVTFYVHAMSPASDEWMEESNEPGRALVFAYAPDAEFARARKVIATHDKAVDGTVREFFDSPAPPARLTPQGDSTITTNDTPTWFYLYFADGSYVAALRHNGGSIGYGVSTKVFSDSGTYYKGTLSPRQTSNLVWGPTGGPYFDPYATSKTCYTDGGGGTCQTMLPYVQTTSATVDSKGTIAQRFGPCINNPDPEQPCIVVYSATIRTTVPW